MDKVKAYVIIIFKINFLYQIIKIKAEIKFY